MSRVQSTLLYVWVGSPLCLHHLVDLASLLTVLSERLAVVCSKLNSPLCTVNLCLNLMLSSLVFHSAGGRASQAGRAVQDVKQVSGDGGDEVSKLGLV